MLHISKLSLGILGLALLLSACSSNPLPGPDAARPSAGRPQHLLHPARDQNLDLGTMP